MHFLQEVKRWLGEITEIFLLLIALGVVVEILFGPATVPFFGQVVPNITAILDSLGQQGLVGLIVLSIVLFLFYKKRVAA